MKRVSGIYKIINKTDGKYYVGSSHDIYKRWRYHREDLTKGNHHSPYLQRAWNKYGSDNFDFVIIELNIIEENLLKEEQKYLDNSNKNICYNTSMIAGKVEMTNEVRKKISDKLMGNKNGIGHEVNEEMRKRISDAQKGKSCPSRGGWKGKKFSDEHKRKLKEARQHQIISESTREKFRQRMIGNTYGKKKTATRFQVAVFPNMT
jgi:group I intron endonuclease